jgi:hypothetical protein
MEQHQAFDTRRALSIPPAPPMEPGHWLETDLLIRSRIRQSHPDLSDDEIWDIIERG